MKIINYGIHDYYDYVLAYGQDERICYNRKVETILLTKELTDFKKIADYWRALGWRFRNNSSVNSLFFDFSIIGFCGVLYPVYWWKDRSLKPIYGMSSEQLLSRVEKEFGDKFKLEDVLDIKTYINRWSYLEDLIDTVETSKKQAQIPIKEAMDQLTKGKEIGLDLFEQLGVPYFHVYRPHIDIVIEKNCNLATLGFPVIMSAEQCYQEVYMFIDNLNAQSRPIDESTRSDEVIAFSKGHDPKQSFKMGSPGKKLKRRKKSKKH